MPILEYACTTCGRPFGRRWTTLRHINKIHDGLGQVETLMGYVVGVKLGKYPFPSYARPSKLPPWLQQGKTKTKDYADSPLHSMAEMARDSAAIVAHFRDYRMLYNPSFAGTMASPYAGADYIVGAVCKKCHYYFPTVVYSGNVVAPIRHECHQKVLAEIESLKEDVRNARYREIYENRLPAQIKSAVDSWIGGQKYVQLEDPPQAVESTTRVDAANLDHYVMRAVKAKSEGKGAVPITDEEVMDLIKKEKVTFAVFEVDGLIPKVMYLVKIVPPSQSQNDEFTVLDKLIEKSMKRQMQWTLDRLQGEEQELKAEQEELNKMKQEAKNTASAVPTDDDLATPSHPGSGRTSPQQPVQPPAHSRPQQEPSKAPGNSSSDQDQPTPAVQPTYVMHKQNLPDGGFRLVLRLKIAEDSDVLKSWILDEMPSRRGNKAVYAVQTKDWPIQALNQASEATLQKGHADGGSALTVEDFGVCSVILSKPEKVVVQLMGRELIGMYCLSHNEADSNRWKFYETSVLELNPDDLQDTPQQSS